MATTTPVSELYLDTVYWHAHDAVAEGSMHRRLLALGHILEQETRQFGLVGATMIGLTDAKTLRRRGYTPANAAALARSRRYKAGQALADLTGDPIETPEGMCLPVGGAAEERIRADLIAAIAVAGIADPKATARRYLAPARCAANASRGGGRGTTPWVLAGAVADCRAVMNGAHGKTLHPDRLRWHPDADDAAARAEKWREACAAYAELRRS